MKAFYRSAALGVSLALLLALLTGCGAAKEPDARELLAQMNEAMAAQSSVSSRLSGTGELTARVEGQEIAVPLSLDMTFELLPPRGLLHAQGSVTAELLSLPWEIPLELYARGNEAYLCAQGTWNRMTVPMGLFDPAGLTSAAALPEEVLVATVLREEAGEIGGKNVRRIDIALDGSLLAASGAEGIAWDGAAAELMLWVDRDTMLPVRQILRLTGLAAGETALRTLDLQMDYTDYTPAEDFSIPPQALSAPESLGLFG